MQLRSTQEFESTVKPELSHSACVATVFTAIEPNLHYLRGVDSRMEECEEFIQAGRLAQAFAPQGLCWFSPRRLQV